MKCAAIFLLACVAVSQAAFTANLVEQAQPALTQAMFKIRLASRAAGDSQPLVSTLQNQANQILAQIESTVATGQAVAAEAINAFQATVQQLTTLGQNSFQTAQAHLQSLFSNIWGNIFGANGRSLLGVVSIAQNLNLGNVISELFNQAQQLVNSLNVEQLLQGLVNQLLQGGSRAGGLFGIVGQLQSAAQQAAANIQALVQQTTTLAGNAFAEVHTFAQNFVAHAQVQVQSTLANASNELLTWLKPYQENLGHIYENIAAQVSTIVGVSA